MEENLINEKNAVAYVINTDGVITDEFHEGDSYKKKTKADKDKENEKLKYVNGHIMDFKDGDIFVKFYTETIPILRKHLTPSEFVFAVSLAEFVSWEDCILRKGTHGNNHIIDMKELSELLDMDYGVVRRLISSLKKKGVIGKHETGTILPDSDSKAKSVYTVNPYIYFRGVNVNKSVATFYENSGWNIY